MTDIPDVLEVAKSGYTLLLENKKVRVMEIKLKPGEKSPMHNHPNDHVIYVVKDAQFKLSFPNGKSEIFDLKTGKSFMDRSRITPNRKHRLYRWTLHCSRN